MKRLPCGALLLLAGSVWAQQQGSPLYSPPDNAPPSLPHPPQGQAPPDGPAPAPEELSNFDIQQHIQKELSAEPTLADSPLDAAVDDNVIVLSGTVGNEQQHVTALHIAASYAGRRLIVDAIQLQEKEGFRL